MKIIAKILFLIILGIGPAFAGSNIPADGKMAFAVYRNGTKIGTHNLTFSKTPKGQTQVDIAIDLLVKLGPIPVYRYTHRNREIWDGNKPLRVNSTTNDDGKKITAAADWDKDNFGAGVFPSSYWNAGLLKAKQFFNTQDGDVVPVKIKTLGTGTVETANGLVQTKTYQINAKSAFTINYDVKSGQWVGLLFKINGADMLYQRLDPL